MTPEDYIEQRLDDQINWYDSKSSRAQKRFKLMRGVEISAAAAVPLLVLFVPVWEPTNFLIALLGALIVVIAGLLGFLRYQEIWIEYRTVSETLKHEKYLYLTQTTPYDQGETFQVLVLRVESLISKENSAWAQQTRESIVAPAPAGADTSDP